MKKWTMALVMGLAITLLSACGGNKYEPVAINEDVDVCAICNMQVKDDAYATQLTTKDGKNYKFDDIGCMNEWKSRNGTDNIGKDYVRDYNDKDWVEYEEATYVYDASIRTPMAYGIVSFKDKKSAEAFIAEQGVGKLMSAKELTQHKWEQNKSGMNMGHTHDGEEGGHEGDGMDMNTDAKTH
jgi:copper chaperone NosL